MPSNRLFTNYFPEPRFQLRLIGLLIAGSLVQITFASGILYYFLRQNYTLLVQYAQLDSEITALLYRELKLLVMILAANFLLFLTGTLIVGTLFSHRVAGPLYALKRTLKSHLEGKPQPLHFRKKDEFQEIAQLFNAVVLSQEKLAAKKTTA